MENSCYPLLMTTRKKLPWELPPSLEGELKQLLELVLELVYRAAWSLWLCQQSLCFGHCGYIISYLFDVVISVVMLFSLMLSSCHLFLTL